MASRAQRCLSIAAAAALLACAHREWRPKFDAKCDCETAAEAKTATADHGDSVTHPTASLLDAARARLAPPNMPDPARTAFLGAPDAFDTQVDDAFQLQRPAAEAAAAAACDPIERDVIPALVQWRAIVDDASSVGDETAAIMARAEMWKRYDGALQRMANAARDAARATLGSSPKAIDAACRRVAYVLLGDLQLPSETELRLVGDRLRAFLTQREAAAREAVADAIATAVVAAHKPRLVAAMHGVP
jgi:hypothetical protein